MGKLGFKRTKKATAAAAVISVLTALLVMIYSEDYAVIPVWGHFLNILAILACIVSFFAIAYKPDSKGKVYVLYYAFIFFLSPFLLAVMVELLNGNFIFSLRNLNWIDNYCMYLLFYMFIFGISGSLRVTSFILSPLFLAFGTINMYVKEFKGGPLVPMDIGSIATATTVAGGYTYTIGMEVSLAVTIAVLVIALSSRLDAPASLYRKRRYAIRGIMLAAVLIVSALFYCTNIFVDLGYKPDFFNQMRGYQNNGALMSFIENTRYMKQNVPDGYDPETLEDELDRTIAGTSQEKSTEVKPDIIVVMNESFADLKVIGDFKTDKEYMPFIDSLKENTIKGYAYTPVFGSGTSNTEFEFLTGNPMAFFQAGSNAYQLYVRSKLPGLTDTLSSQGYSTVAMHPYFRANWNRIRVYDWMGFDEYYGFEDLFDEEDTDYYINHGGNYFTFNKQLEEKYDFDDVLLRKYVSDAYNYKELVEIYKKRDRSRPFFMFNVTMQNHSPYNLIMEKDNDFVHLEGLEGSYPMTEQYLTIIRKSDKAFKSLVKYYESVDRPVIILMFGDHQPYVEEGFYEEVMGKSVSELTDEEQLKRYMSKFVIWANYDIDEQELRGISTNYLSSLLTDQTGIKTPKYDRFISKVKENVPVITPFGCMDRNGRFFTLDDDSNYDDLIDLYAKLSYNNCIDSDNIVNDIFRLP